MAHDRKIVPITSSADAGADNFAPNRPSCLPAPLIPVRTQAADFLKSSLTALFDNADDSLFEMADRAGSNNEQTLFFEAMRAVRLQRHRITKDCCIGLLRELEALSQAADKPAVTATHNFELDSLALVQPDELEETVALDSMIGRAVTRNKASLSHLAVRFNSLVKRRVDDRDLPVSPTMLCQVFVAALSDLQLDIKVRLIIFKLFERYVFNQLDGFYAELNQQLILAGVLPDLKNTAGRQAPARMTGAPTTTGQAYRQAEGGRQDMAEHQQVLSMFSELIGNWRHASGDAALSTLGSGSTHTLRSKELLGMLADLSGSDFAAQASQRLDMRAQINHLLRRQREQGGQSRALERVDDDVISLVSMLFDFILDDPQLPCAVKAMIGRLQLPILRVAIADKHFFSQSSHPARRLLNELARSTMGWSDQDDLRRDQLHALLDSIVQRLLDQPEPNPELFARLHTELASFINVEKRRSERLAQRTHDAEEGRARIDSARHHVAVSLNALLMGKTLAVFAVDLLRDTWSQVMQMTCLREGPESAAWHEVKRTAEQLLESIEPLGDSTASAREALNAQVRQSIAAGLQLIGLGAEQGAPVLVKVQQLQQLRFTQGAASAPQRESIAGPGARPHAAAVQPLIAAGPVARRAPPATGQRAAEVYGAEPSALKPTAVVATVRVVVPLLQAEVSPPQPELLGDVPDIKAAAWVEALHTGSWFELMTTAEEPAQRCQLAAVIRFNGKYIFANRSGMKVAEYSANSLALHYAQGLIRLLDDNQLFDRALASVIGNLRRLQASKN